MLVSFSYRSLINSILCGSISVPTAGTYLSYVHNSYIYEAMREMFHRRDSRITSLREGIFTEMFERFVKFILLQFTVETIRLGNLLLIADLHVIDR